MQNQFYSIRQPDLVLRGRAGCRSPRVHGSRLPRTPEVLCRHRLQLQAVRFKTLLSKWANPGLCLVLSNKQYNFTLNRYVKNVQMSIQYIAPGLEPTTL